MSVTHAQKSGFAIGEDDYPRTPPYRYDLPAVLSNLVNRVLTYGDVRRHNIVPWAGNRAYSQKLGGLARGRRDGSDTTLERRHTLLEYVL